MFTSDAEPFEERLDTPLREFWFERLDRHFHDTYMGLRMQKFPEDLRLYELLLWDMRADFVVELGADEGASALWFRDRLAAMARVGRIKDFHVITVDIETHRTRPGLEAVDPDYARDITLIQGDVLDPELPARVRTLVRPGARCFVIEDSAHVHATSFAALRGFADFVPVGGWFVVEDGCVDVDALRPSDDWPRGVQPAINEWLASPEGAGFSQHRDAELYGITCHPGGFLQRER